MNRCGYGRENPKLIVGDDRCLNFTSAIYKTGAGIDFFQLIGCRNGGGKLSPSRPIAMPTARVIFKMLSLKYLEPRPLIEI